MNYDFFHVSNRHKQMVKLCVPKSLLTKCYGKGEDAFLNIEKKYSFIYRLFKINYSYWKQDKVSSLKWHKVTFWKVNRAAERQSLKLIFF